MNKLFLIADWESCLKKSCKIAPNSLTIWTVESRYVYKTHHQTCHILVSHVSPWACSSLERRSLFCASDTCQSRCRVGRKKRHTWKGSVSSPWCPCMSRKQHAEVTVASACLNGHLAPRLPAPKQISRTHVTQKTSSVAKRFRQNPVTLAKLNIPSRLPSWNFEDLGVWYYL